MVIVGVVEIAVLLSFVLLRERFPSCTAEISQSVSGLLPGAGNSFEGGGTGSIAPPQVGAVKLVSPQPQASDDAAAAGGSVDASGDTNQVPDPNCVAKTAAGLLSESAPPAQPSCAPMSPPPELKKAEQQLSNGSMSSQSAAASPSPAR